MARQFGEKYKNLIGKNPNQKSIPNTNPGIEFGIFKTKNPYTELIARWDFAKVVPSAPLIGREVIVPLVDTYYVDNGYVDDGYVEVQQAPVL
jgi:hypothetical protein